MNKQQMAREIRLRTGLDMKLQDIRKILDAEEDIIYECIGACDYYKYKWGVIYGIEKPPKKITGKFSEFNSIKSLGGWSNWKIGFPQIQWEPNVRKSEAHPPSIYFDLPENRYTSDARQFRKENRLPEIPEFEGLPEEKIQEMCKKADASREAKGWTKPPTKYIKTREIAEEATKEKCITTAKMRRKHWIEEGILPIGVKEFTEEQIEGITELDKQYRTRDRIDAYIDKTLPVIEDLREKYDFILTLIDLSEWREDIDLHQELFEYKEQYEKEMEEQGLKPYTHIKKDYGKRFIKKPEGDDLSEDGIFNEKTGQKLVEPVYPKFYTEHH